MPLPLGQSLKLLPPDVQRIKFGPEVVDAIRMLASYLRANAVSVANDHRQFRDVLNWLITQQHIINLVPDSGATAAATNWTVNAPWSLVTAQPPSGGNAFQAAGGTGQVVGLTAIPVLANTTYSFSGWIDAQWVTAGTVSWQVWSGASLLGEATQLNGSSGRVETYVDTEANTAVTVRLDATGVAVSGAHVVTAMQPQLELPLVTQGAGAEGATLYRTTSLPSGGASVSRMMSAWEPLIGVRDGFNTDFTIAVGTIALGTNGNPLTSVYQGGATIPYTAGAPGPFQWTLSGQTYVLGTPPTGTATDEPIVEWVVLQ